MKEIKVMVPGLKIAATYIDSVIVKESNNELQKELLTAQEQIKVDFLQKEITSDPYISSTRNLFKKTGIDPTRYRASQEALIRRILQGKGIPRINNVVDVNNLCSVRFRLPMGVYDLDKIQGEIEIRIGRQGESFQGIGARSISAQDKIMAFDKLGPFGSPIADAERTKVTLSTNRIILVIFSSESIPETYLKNALDATIDKLIRYCSATRIRSTLIGS